MKTNVNQVSSINESLHEPGRPKGWLGGRSLFGVLLGCTMIGIAANAYSVPFQWDIASGGNGHFYEAILVGTNITWDASRSAAQLLGGDLATITSSAENEFVKGLFAGNSAFFYQYSTYQVHSGPWIGAYASSYTAGDWAWVTGEPFSFTAWGPSEPFKNGDHISYARFFGNPDPKWNDIPSGHAASPQSYIVEIVPEPTSLWLAALGFGLAGLGRGYRRLI
jgi:hypothetical protein